jgi:hypothetical protein
METKTMKKSLHICLARNKLVIAGMMLWTLFWPVEDWAANRNVWITNPENTREQVQFKVVAPYSIQSFQSETSWPEGISTWTWTEATRTSSSYPYSYAQRNIGAPGEIKDVTATYNGEIANAITIVAVSASINLSSDRIPIYGSPYNIQGSATITLNPSPVPLGLYVQVDIMRNCGTSGGATFPNSSLVTFVGSTSTLHIQGFENSDCAHNMTIKVENESAYFSVRTWPLNMRELTQYRSAADGTLFMKYGWDSESGNILQLTDITMGEIVYYNHDWNVPPYSEARPNPTYRHNWPATTGTMGDTHDYPGFSPPPYVFDYMTGTQYYRFTDDVLERYNYINIMGPLYISRTIENMSPWTYMIIKGDFGTSKPLP